MIDEHQIECRLEMLGGGIPHRPSDAHGPAQEASIKHAHKEKEKNEKKKEKEKEKKKKKRSDSSSQDGNGEVEMQLGKRQRAAKDAANGAAENFNVAEFYGMASKKAVFTDW